MEIYRLKPYAAVDGWRWRAIAENGRIVGTGAEAYANEANCKAAIRRFVGAQLSMFDDNEGETNDEVQAAIPMGPVMAEHYPGSDGSGPLVGIVDAGEEPEPGGEHI